MFILCLRPYYVQVNPVLNDIWKYGMASFAVVSIIQVFLINRMKNTSCLYLFCVSYLIGTIHADNGDISGAFSYCAQIILANNVGIILKHCNSRRALSLISSLIALCIYFDCILGALQLPILLGKDNVYTLWGYDNYAAYVLLPLIAAKCGIDYYIHGKLVFNDYCCVILMIIYKLYTLSLNAIVFFSMYFVLLVVIKNYDLLIKRLKLWHVLAANILLITLIVKFEVYKKFEEVLKYLGKGNNFGYRADFWKRTVRILLETPVFGYGKYQGSFFATLIGYNPIYYLATTHAHNFILDLWLQTGIVGMSLYYLYVYKCLRGVTIKPASLSERIILLGIIVYYLMGLVDAYPFISTSYFLLGLYGFTQYMVETPRIGEKSQRYDLILIKPNNRPL